MIKPISPADYNQSHKTGTKRNNNKTSDSDDLFVVLSKLYLFNSNNSDSFSKIDLPKKDSNDKETENLENLLKKLADKIKKKKGIK